MCNEIEWQSQIGDVIVDYQPSPQHHDEGDDEGEECRSDEDEDDDEEEEDEGNISMRMANGSMDLDEEVRDF